MLFCETPDTDGELREACTMEIDSRVRSVAHELCDVNLISKLSTGDMVALGAKYHSSGLAALYNRARQNSKGGLSEGNGQSMLHSTVLAELISDVQNSRTEDPRTTVFKLSDLRKEFRKRLKLQGVTAENPEIHSTRLKEKLIEAIPGLTAHIKGREVLLAFEEDIGSLISHALPGDKDDNAMCLERTANIVREEMFNESSSVTGSVTQGCQKGSVPQGLLSLVTMILEGPNAKCQLTAKPSQAALTLAQLLKFNSVKHARKTEQCTRHIKSQETPRKRDLIDRVHALGMSISYDHVLRLSSDMANAVCEHFKETDTVCPPNLKRNVFTTAAVDNIDHNTSSTNVTTLEAKTAGNGKAVSKKIEAMVLWSAYHGERQQHAKYKMSEFLTTSFCRMCAFSTYDKACHNCCYESSGAPQPRTNCRYSV